MRAAATTVLFKRQHTSADKKLHPTTTTRSISMTTLNHEKKVKLKTGYICLDGEKEVSPSTKFLSHVKGKNERLIFLKINITFFHFS